MQHFGPWSLTIQALSQQILMQPTPWALMRVEGVLGEF